MVVVMVDNKIEDLLRVSAGNIRMKSFDEIWQVIKERLQTGSKEECTDTIVLTNLSVKLARS